MSQQEAMAAAGTHRGRNCNERGVMEPKVLSFGAVRKR